MKVAESKIAEFCRKYADAINPLPKGIDAAQLLWALSGNESLFGYLTRPRHESSYCVKDKGRYSQSMREIFAEFGCWACCSYGPLQVMFVNSRLKFPYTPMDLIDPDVAFDAAVTFLTKRVLPGAKSLDDIGDAYNSGNYRDSNIPYEYISRLRSNYLRPMPPIEVK